MGSYPLGAETGFTIYCALYLTIYTPAQGWATTLGSRYPNKKDRDSLSEQILSELFDLRRLDIQTAALLSKQGSKSCLHQKFNTEFCWFEYGELKNLYSTSSLKSEKKPFCYFCQLFDPKGIGIRTVRPRYLNKTGVSVSEQFGYRNPSVFSFAGHISVKKSSYQAEKFRGSDVARWSDVAPFCLS